MSGLLKLLGKAGKAAIKSKHAPAVAGTAAYAAGAGYVLTDTGVLQFDPWGDKKEAYEQKKGEEFIKQEAYDRSAEEAKEAYDRSQMVEAPLNSFGMETPEQQEERIHQMHSDGIINSEEYKFLIEAITRY